MPSPLPGLSGQRARLPPGVTGHVWGGGPGHNSPPFFSGPGMGLTCHSLQGRTDAPSGTRAAGKDLADLK